MRHSLHTTGEVPSAYTLRFLAAPSWETGIVWFTRRMAYWACSGSQAPTAAVDNSAPYQPARAPQMYRGRLFKSTEPLLRRSPVIARSSGTQQSGPTVYPSLVTTTNPLDRHVPPRSRLKAECAPCDDRLGPSLRVPRRSMRASAGGRGSPAPPYTRHCEEPRDEAIQYQSQTAVVTTTKPWIATSHCSSR